MLRLIIVIAALVAFNTAPAHAKWGDCSVLDANGIDDRCDWYHRTPGIKPAIPNMVCIWTVQMHPGTVLPTLYHIDGSVEHYPPKKMGTTGWVCFGRRKVLASEKVNICNSEGDTTYEEDDIPRLLAKPERSEAMTACLYGAERCREAGFREREQ